MSITIGDAILYIMGDDKGLNKTLDGVQGKIDKSLSSLQNKLNTWGNRMTLGVTAPIVALGAKAISHASDLQETIDKSGVVFGDSAAEVEKFGDTAAQAMGMSKNTAMAAAATYGNLFRAVGMASDQSADMSMNLVQLAADLASFNNMDPTEVLDKLRAGLMGEKEPVQAFGVQMDAARIKAKALELGLWDGVGAISASAKMAAAYAIILEDTELAQGNFADTAEGAANQTNILNSELEDLLAKLGTAILPLFEKVQRGLIELLGYFSNLPDGVQNGIVAFLGLAAAAGPVSKALALLISPLKWIALTAIPWLAKIAIPGLVAGIGSISAPVLILIGLIGALIAAIYFLGPAAWKSFTMISEIVYAWIKRLLYDWFRFIGTFMTFSSDMADSVLFSFDRLFGGAYDTFMMFADLIAASLNRAGYEIERFWETIKRFVSDMASSVRQSFARIGENMVAGIQEGIQRKWAELKANVTASMNDLLAGLRSQLGIASPSKLFANEIGKPLAQGIGQGYQAEMVNSLAQMLQPLTPAPFLAAAQGNQLIQVGHVEYHGRFSQAEMAYLAKLQERMAENVTLKALRRVD